MCRRNCFFISFLLIIFSGAYFISRQETQQYRHDHKGDIRSNDDELVGDERLAALRKKDKYKAMIANAVAPYTIPTEVDYETIAEIMPHMWRRAVESPLPKSCEFITFDHSPNMDIGESMFTHASLYGVARKTNRVPFIDHKLAFSLLQTFQFKFMPTAGVSVDGSFTKHRESLGCCRYDDSFLNISCTRKTILTGYLQNYQYFKEYSLELASTEFVFQESVAHTCAKKYTHLLSSNGLLRNTSKCQLVGVHIRHSDDITNRQKQRGHMAAKAEYLKRAFEYFKEKFSKSSCLAFLVTGSEGTKIKDLVPDIGAGNGSKAETIVKTVFFQGASDAVRLCMLTMTHHTIMTTGATGWWAAFLTQQRNKGRVLYQQEYAKPDSELTRELDRDTYFPKSWIAM